MRRARSSAVEQGTFNPLVLGSNPSGLTNRSERETTPLGHSGGVVRCPVDRQSDRLRPRRGRQDRVHTVRGIALELDDSARELIVTEGYDPVYGARPLKRAIQTLIQNPLAVSLLKGDIAGGQTIVVSAENGEMKFTPKAGEKKAVSK